MAKHAGGRPKKIEPKFEKINITLNPDLLTQVKDLSQAPEGPGTISATMRQVLEIGLQQVKMHPGLLAKNYLKPYEVTKE